MKYNPHYNEMLYRTIKGDHLLFDEYPTQVVKKNYRKENYFLTETDEKIPYGEVDQVLGIYQDTGEFYTKFLRFRTFHK